MVQRSSTHIVRSDTLMDIGLGDLYSERALDAGVTTFKADTIFASLPYRIMHEFQIPLYQQMAERDKDFYDRLEASGFRHDWGADGSGLFMKYLRRGSGYYIDVGAADLVANGQVPVKQGQVVELTETGVKLDSGEELPADLVVYATGYGSMNGLAADIVGQEIADAVGKVWGLGSDTTKDPGPWEGEQRNMWKPTQQEGLWFHGGNLHQSRYYSLYLALQLKARAEGIPTPGVRAAGGAPHVVTRLVGGRAARPPPRDHRGRCRSRCGVAALAPLAAITPSQGRVRRADRGATVTDVAPTDSDALMRRPDRLYDGYVFDLDGTVYLGDALLPGAADVIARLRALGRRTVFLSNNPTRDPQMYADKLDGLGIPTPVADIVNPVVTVPAWLQAHHPGAGVFAISEEPLEAGARRRPGSGSPRTRRRSTSSSRASTAPSSTASCRSPSTRCGSTSVPG